MHKANIMLAQNGGNLNTPNRTATRHSPAPSVVGNYHQRSQSMCNVVSRHAHGAVQGALLAAGQEFVIEQTVPSLNIGMIQEQVAMHRGREIAETMHGDSGFATDLAAIASAAGSPTTFTTLAGNGRIFNARNIPTSNRQHRQANNQLAPMDTVDGRSCQDHPGTSQTLFPTGLNALATAATTVTTSAANSAASAANDHQELHNLQKAMDESRQ